MQAGPYHPAIQPLEWLIGKWKSVQAEGAYPSVKPFTYEEEIEFISLGQPMLNYVSTSWHATNLNPMHLESGYLRIKPGTKDVSFVVAHNFGLTSIEEGKNILLLLLKCLITYFCIIFRICRWINIEFKIYWHLTNEFC